MLEIRRGSPRDAYLLLNVVFPHASSDTAVGGTYVLAGAANAPTGPTSASAAMPDASNLFMIFPPGSQTRPSPHPVACRNLAGTASGSRVGWSASWLRVPEAAF